jgi:Cytochrome P460
MQITLWAAVLAAPVLAAVAVPALPWPEPSAKPVTAAPADESPVMPAYDRDRALRLPEDYRQWVFVGSSLGLSYEASASGHEMFHETLMEPTAYRHFVKTGEFREGTMFVLMLHGTERAVLPGRRGQFAGELHGVEMAVKDKTRTPEGWAYYGFGGMGSIAKAAQPEGSGCFNCHKTHAARDNVFLQFYPLLAEAARLTTRKP